MKPIKISAENAQTIETTLRAGNGRATAHTWTSYGSILDLANEAEQALENHLIPKAMRSGATCTKSSGGYLANAYNNTAIQTTATIERRSSAWYLTEVEATTLYPKTNNRARLSITQEQADYAIKRFLADVAVLPRQQVREVA